MFTFFMGLEYAHSLSLPHNVMIHFIFKQEANKNQLEKLMGIIEFEFLMNMTYHIVTR